MTIQTMRDFGIGEGQIYIGGRWVDSASRDRREIENPKDESVVALVPSSTIEDADRAVAAARKAQPEWSRRTPMERGALLQKLATLIDENTETLATLLTAEGGKLLPESRIDANFAALLLRYAAESARRLQGEILPGEGRDEQIWIQRVPYGVVAGITAWNFPAALFARKVGPALVTGNTIVVKPHELTPLATLVLGELSRRAGIPEGVINIVVGDGRAARSTRLAPNASSRSALSWAAKRPSSSWTTLTSTRRLMRLCSRNSSSAALCAPATTACIFTRRSTTNSSTSSWPRSKNSRSAIPQATCRSARASARSK
jgi:hypothetical protein